MQSLYPRSCADLHPIHLAQQIVHIRGDIVDQTGVQGLCGGHSFGIIDHILCQGDCLLAAPLGQGTRSRLEDFFLLERLSLGQILPAWPYRTGGANGCYRCHSGDVPGHGQQRTGTTGPGTVGRYIDDHRDTAGANVLDHTVHQDEIAAGCIEL